MSHLGRTEADGWEEIHQHHLIHFSVVAVIWQKLPPLLYQAQTHKLPLFQVLRSTSGYRTTQQPPRDTPTYTPHKCTFRTELLISAIKVEQDWKL